MHWINHWFLLFSPNIVDQMREELYDRLRHEIAIDFEIDAMESYDESEEHLIKVIMDSKERLRKSCN